ARAAYQPNPLALKRNVVLIVVDALRADRMGVYGYPRGTTPNLDRLAAAGVVRKPAQTRSACSASVCGLVSLLTSKFVHEFSARPVSLHEILKLHGYRIQLILGGDHENFYGLKQLFGQVDDYHDGSHSRGAYSNDDGLVLERVEALPRWDGAPVLIQFHLMSTHILGRRHKEHSPFSPAASYAIPANRHPPLVDNFYDNGVTQADAVIHRILGTLRDKGYLRETLVVITADHGESLGEGGRYSHSQSVAEEAVRIPLLLVAYGYRASGGWREGIVASQVDVAPTIVAELGIAPARTWSGMALQSAFTRPFTYYQEGYAAGLIDHRDARRPWKYWVDSKGAREHAYDLAADPGETSNVISAVPEILKREWRLEYLRFQPGGTGLETTFTR
ncbi:MAG TPA: sulfatase-like hydrolase/transferase, partial [Burkholderiales bacterium]|nr:sulfatase-like hydrolase/transferase [Burkholderiales bacterium]